MEARSANEKLIALEADVSVAHDALQKEKEMLADREEEAALAREEREHLRRRVLDLEGAEELIQGQMKESETRCTDLAAQAAKQEEGSAAADKVLKDKVTRLKDLLNRSKEVQKEKEEETVLMKQKLKSVAESLTSRPLSFEVRAVVDLPEGRFEGVGEPGGGVEWCLVYVPPSKGDGGLKDQVKPSNAKSGKANKANSNSKKDDKGEKSESSSSEEQGADEGESEGGDTDTVKVPPLRWVRAADMREWEKQGSTITGPRATESLQAAHARIVKALEVSVSKAQERARVEVEELESSFSAYKTRAQNALKRAGAEEKEKKEKEAEHSSAVRLIVLLA